MLFHKKPPLNFSDHGLEVDCLALSTPSGLGAIARKAMWQGLYSFGGHVKYR